MVGHTGPPDRTADRAESVAERILGPLNQQQRAAAQVVSGPVVIHAGAGTGKTRVISHRAAYAAATGAMDPGKALFLTFTDKAATEMAQRVEALGVPGVTAMTFHKAAWRQLRYFWPQLNDGEQLSIQSEPWRIVSPMVRRLPGHYRFTPTQDVLDLISWVKTRRVPLVDLPVAAGAAGRALPLPDDLFARVFEGYVRTCRGRGLVDFDDMILRLLDVLQAHPDLLAQVRNRYAWFSVDEFQDTNAIQFELLRLWVGDRDDVCVVGDEHQTIYTFAGATSEFLRSFERWYPGAQSFALTVNYRSSPQVLQLANRLLRASDALQATVERGPEPVIEDYGDDVDELDGIVATVRGWLARGVRPGEVAVLVRLNADIPPLEHALTRAGIPFRVRGTRFFERRDIVMAVDLLARADLAGTDPPATGTGDAGLAAAAGPGPVAVGTAAPPGWVRRYIKLLGERLGFDPDEEPETPQARERQAALSTLVSLVGDLAAAGDSAHVVAELRDRAVQERRSSVDGVELLTLHRAKGLEWDAVVLPGLEEGHLPVQQAVASPALVDEERRLLYVGITRARRHLVLSWAGERPGPGGRVMRKQMSHFLAELQPPQHGPGSGSWSGPASRRGGGSSGGSGGRGSPGTGGRSRGGAQGGKRQRNRARRDPQATSGGSPDLGANTGLPVSSASAADEGGPLYEDLKAWRLERSRADEVPAYVVFPNSTLALIARAQPADLTELATISGVGPAKLAAYGEDVLAIVARHH